MIQTNVSEHTDGFCPVSRPQRKARPTRTGLVLVGKIAVVTGASRGIGRAIALALARSGADVAVCCHTADIFAERVRNQVLRLGRKSECYAHNIADPAEVEKLHAEVIRDFGRVDILVNNAGITCDRPFQKMTKLMWDAVLDVDLDGVFLVTKQFLDEMAERGWGRVINLSSVIGEVGSLGQVNYAAAKAAVIGFTKALAREYARKGVTVNAVAPGFIKTQRTESIPAAALDAVVQTTPVGRLGMPEEVAAGVVYLASPAAAFVTGHVLDINGGFAL